MSLRRTLVSLQIALVAVGLLVFGVTSYQLFRQSEAQRLQSQLSQTDLPALEMALCQQEGASSCAAGLHGAPAPAAPTAAITPTTKCPNGASRIFDHNLTPGSFAVLRSLSGSVLAQLYIPFPAPDDTTGTCPDPALPRSIPKGTFTVNALKGPGPFLVTSQELSASGFPTQPGAGAGFGDADGDGGAPDPATSVIIAGVPLNELHASLHRLLVVDLLVGSVLLVALAGGSLLLIRRSLRPLERMAATSRDISAGDLSHRVTTTDDRSEVGQLGSALNGMLTRIENAFAERDATEQRLRQFLADASHELRTPLTSIRGYAELWRLAPRAQEDRPPAAGNGSDLEVGKNPDVGGNPDGGRNLDVGLAMARIEEHARRMGEMIEELLLLARLDDFHPAQNTPVDLAVLAAEACDDASALDHGRPISLDAAEGVVVIGELPHLRRAVANLMTNAIRHTPPGTRIEVQVLAGDGVAQVIVRDHGPGLPDAGLAHAFDRFWQADASRATGGSGLGLAIVAGVAAEHGGAAMVANAPDGGAIFSLRLPMPLPGPVPDPAATTRRGAGGLP